MYDVHTHFVPAPVMEWVRAEAATIRAVFERRDPTKAEFLVVNGKWGFELKPTFIDAEGYLQAQAAAGVTYALVSPIPQLFAYEFEPAVTEALASVYNQALVEWVAQHPDRLGALATVPLNAPERAATLLEAALDRGLLGAIVAPGIGSRTLTDASFLPLWEVADQRRAILFIHPLLNEDPRVQRRMMPNLIGVPWETTLAATDLILAGYLDRFPRVRILLAHGGGFLPYQVGRLTQGYEKWSPVRAVLQAPPEAYLQRLWYDGILWDQRSLALLAAVVGEDRVLPGSDFPFDLSVWPPRVGSDAGARQFLGRS
ncbi:MAG: amidohydrolase [Firmicutes bacterium]|nr:amidohydrolase [Alicyclobacillaceae bacterium]MCL6496316.1 amidohydrolase [Bacillota bacterium]